jgi:hypothetical protein
MNFINDFIYGELNTYISKLSKDKDEINRKTMNVDYLFGYVLNFLDFSILIFYSH